MPEITHHCQKTPFLLVGTQVDLRDDQSVLDKLAKNKQRPINFEQGEKLAKELKAVKYVECSALTQVLRQARGFSFLQEMKGVCVPTCLYVCLYVKEHRRSLNYVAVS